MQTRLKCVHIIFMNGDAREIEYTDMAGTPHPDIVVFQLVGGAEAHLNLKHIVSMDFSGIERARNDIVIPN